MKNKEQLDNYNKTGHLLNKKIVCTGCTTHITCFGSNLQSKISKYGGLETLLDTFLCRSCTSASKPKKEKKVSVRVTKAARKEESVKLGIPKMKFTPPRDIALKDAPDIIKSMTEHACAAPNYYLDNGRNCAGCAYNEHCLCHLKVA